MTDITVEVAGYPDTLNASLRLVTRFGKVIIVVAMLFGLLGDTTAIDPQHLMSNCATVNPTAGELGEGRRELHIANMVS